ncbi:MAG: TlyA family RNA methyltransferase [Erysipelotrichaceae bacterium]|nr:TlyA family RNA methyltransferase [Erysipelotrichaceae bacterium]
MKKKLSQYLVENLGFSSRSQARNHIKEGNILVNGRIITKDGFPVDENDEIIVKNHEISYVSRGGRKLEAALKEFSVDLDNLTVLDIGASTGGFTECCLRYGAKKVYAYDVGHDQLHQSLKDDPRVISREGINCRYLTKNDFEEPIQFICMDVSFISCILMLEAIADILEDGCKSIVLFKPQFEIGADKLDSHGIWKDSNAVHDSLMNCQRTADKLKLGMGGIMPSPVKGQDGNQEYLLLFVKNGNNSVDLGSFEC